MVISATSVASARSDRCRDETRPVWTPWSSTSSYLFLLGDLLLWFGDDLLLFGQDHLDVAGRAHVGVDAAVSAIRASPHLGGLVDLDVFDDQRVHIQALRTKPSRKAVRTRAGQISLATAES